MLHTIKIILIVLAIVVALILIIRRIYKSYPRKTLAMYKGVSRVYVHSFSPKPRVFVDLNTGEITRTGYTGSNSSDYRYSEEYELPNGKKSFSTGRWQTEECKEYGYLTYNLEGKHVFKRDDSVKQAFEEACEASIAHNRETKTIKSWIVCLSHAFLPLLCMLFTYVFSTFVSSEGWNTIFMTALTLLYICLSWPAIKESDNPGRTLLFCWIGFSTVAIPFALWQFASSLPKHNSYEYYPFLMSAAMFPFSGIKAIIVTIVNISRRIQNWSRKKTEEMWNK